MQAFSEKVYDWNVVGISIIALDSKWISIYLVSLNIPIFHSFNFSLL